MKTFSFPIAVLEQAATARPAGYLAAVMAAGVVHGEGNNRVVLLTEDSYAALARQFSGKTAEQLNAIIGGKSPTVGGPGSELKFLLRDWLGIDATPGCSCNSMAAEMDRRGPDWSESDEGLAKILGVMRAEHAKRWNARQTLLPWSDTAAKALIRLACHRARAKAAS